MSATSVPKVRLVELILDDLKALDQAITYFHITTAQSYRERLLSFTKVELITFIISLGDDAERALRFLESGFPFRKAPTLYLTIFDRLPDAGGIIARSHELVPLQRGGALFQDEKKTVRAVYITEPAQVVRTDYEPVVEIQLLYEMRVEIVEADTKAEDYGQIKPIYSLETAYVWIPIENHHHAIIACCDYQAIRPVRNYLRTKLQIDLDMPWLTTEMMQQISQGADPRSVTFALKDLNGGDEEVQSVTYSDPNLSQKGLFWALADDNHREQTFGFFMNHPGLALGGIGIARRDGKVWTPKRLDKTAITHLALTLITQTEEELAKSEDHSSLIHYYFGSDASIGGKQIGGQKLVAWRELVSVVFQGQGNLNHEIQIRTGLLSQAVEYQNQLCLTSAVEYECPECHCRWLARCPNCQRLLRVKWKNDFVFYCPNRKCKKEFMDHLNCECGQEIPIEDPAAFVCLFPEKAFIDSVISAGTRLNHVFTGFFVIRGQQLLHLPPRNIRQEPLRLNAFRSWHNIMENSGAPVLTQEDAIKLLNRMREKCFRGGTWASSRAKCEACLNSPVVPYQIENREVCLLRLFGLPINQTFDGLHNGGEVADLYYDDWLIKTGEKVKVGIHVKSRDKDNPVRGMGRSKNKIQELYAQLVYSAYLAITGKQELHILGIGIPNEISNNVMASMFEVMDELGYPFLAVDEKDWTIILNRAYEVAMFEK